MVKLITKLKLHNFRRFYSFSLEFNPGRNLLIGDNESGKSSILQAIDLVVSGSRSKIETLGLENLFNAEVICKYLSGEKRFADLPEMWIEVYLNEQNNPGLNGRNNSEKIITDGLTLICSPMDEYSAEITEILSEAEPSFPFEYYSIRFHTFSGESYTGYRRFLRHLLLDSSQINNEYATREYVKSVYRANTEDPDRNKHQNEYRKYKTQFRDTVLRGLNSKLGRYQFSIVTSTKSNLEADLVITEDDISIENKGKGRQCFIKTEFALKKKKAAHPLDVLLLEEPENHLSHANMKRLVVTIAHAEEQQMIVATHNSLICSRLDLRNAILLNSSSEEGITLRDLPKDTASFFIKAPDNNVLEFVLSGRVILVEGDAEYILMQALYENVTGRELEETDIHVISVRGTSFKRYLDLAKMLGVRTAVIRDNDGDYENNCLERYKNYISDNIQVFSERSNDVGTFEVAVYRCNQAVCDELFTGGKIRLSPQDYMLMNKAEAAFRLLINEKTVLDTPEYIRDAIRWISE